MSTTHLTRRHHQYISPSVMTFPLEFKSLKPVLKTFIATLFEENPYQFKPIFRGFYFTSALQEGVIESPMTEQIAEEFHLIRNTELESYASKKSISQDHGYFLKGLFSNVILKDKNLVQQYINPHKKRQRFMAFIGALLAVAIILSLWVWSYRNNLQLIAEVQADLNKVSLLQSQSGSQLSAQLDGLLILQGQLQKLDQYAQNRPLKYSFGLYQGTALRHKLQDEYLNGIEQIIAKPVQTNIASFLTQVNANENKLKANHINVTNQHKTSLSFVNEPSPENTQDAYNALKTYLMLSNRQYLDASHLSDQITRFWRPWLEMQRGDMPRAEMLQKAEQILSYSMSLSAQDKFPQLNSDAVLVEQTRQVLSAVTTGTSARDRVYNEIKMRAQVRFPALSVNQIIGEPQQKSMLGSYALPGIFTYKAWNEYIEEAIETVATEPTDSRDWVLNISQSDDLSFSGSPEQIRKQLIALYKEEYISEWRKFLTGIHYAKSNDFNGHLEHIELLGEPESSPIRRLLLRAAQETSWDHPIVQAELAIPQKGFFAWFKRKVLKNDTASKAKVLAQQHSHGVIAKEFQVFYQLVRQRDDLQQQSLLDGYMQSLAKIRSQFHDLKNSGEIGPASIEIVKQTIDGQSSIFNITQKYVDEKMRVGVSAQDQQVLQKLLVMPLTQSFERLIPPAQEELNKLWFMQAHQPFKLALEQKYPFNSTAHIQATSAEIAQIFGESGSISKYVKEHLDPFVIRRGYTLTSKTWMDLGLTLNPSFVAHFQNYVAPASGIATGQLHQNSTVTAVSSHSNFQFYPLENPNILAYTIEIDGQRMVYENGIQQWVNFVWPNPGNVPGARITAIDIEGITHTVFDQPGEYGIHRLIESAKRNQKGNIFELSWVSPNNSDVSIKMNFRLVSGQATNSVGGNANYHNLKLVEQVVSEQSTRVVAAQIASTNQNNSFTRNHLVDEHSP